MPGPFAQEMNPGDNTGESLLRRRSASRLNIFVSVSENLFSHSLDPFRTFGARLAARRASALDALAREARPDVVDGARKRSLGLEVEGRKRRGETAALHDI